MTDYVSPAAYVLNDNLRNGYPLTEQQQTIVDNLDKALDKFPLYTDAEPLNRSLLFMYQEDAEKFVSDALEKGYIQEKSYASSTQHGVYNSEDNVRMVIRRVTLEDNLTAFLLIQKMKYFLRETPSLLLLMHT
ncbi:hypothetical protein lacNasYZ02_08370 [Lactobacillus nasalidis]|nr:hypothetical protein lacNasYZ02_08370 [Lactobacillus nasalidis]